MKNINKEVFKKNYYNYKTLIVIISFVILLILSLKYTFFLYPLFLILIILIMSLISYIKEIKFLNEVYSYKNGSKKFSYKPIDIESKKLIDIMKKYGLPLTYIKLEKIYSIEVVKLENQYLCYIDEKEFSDLDEFLNYNIDNQSLLEVKKIKVLSFDNDNPKEINKIY